MTAQIKITLVFAGLCLALLGGAVRAESISPTEVVLRGGVTVELPVTDLSATLRLVTDQRCPVDVACYWEGMRRIEVDVVQGRSAPVRIVLCNLCQGATDSATIDGVTLTFTQLEPSTEDLRALGRQPELADYSALISVSPAR